MNIPEDFPVRPLLDDENPIGRCTCAECGLSWDNDKVTEYTPVPSSRCPFESFHEVIGPLNINGISTTNIRLDIACNSHPSYGLSNEKEVIAALKEFVVMLESGLVPMNYENSVKGISVRYH